MAEDVPDLGGVEVQLRRVDLEVVLVPARSIVLCAPVMSPMRARAIACWNSSCTDTLRWPAAAAAFPETRAASSHRPTDRACQA
jgi:hypothetical protein